MLSERTNGEERRAQLNGENGKVVRFRDCIIMMLEYSPSSLWQFEVARTSFNLEIISAVFYYCLIASSLILYKKWKEVTILHHKTTWETVNVIKCIHLE